MRATMITPMPAITAPVNFKQFLPSERTLVALLILALIGMAVMTVAAITPLQAEVIKFEAQTATLMKTVPCASSHYLHPLQNHLWCSVSVR